MKTLDVTYAHSQAIEISIIGLIVALIIFPVLRYIFAGHALKQSEILDGQGPIAARQYFEMFRPKVAADKKDARRELEKLYEKWYGRQWFVMPLVILTAVASVAAYVEVTSAMQVLSGQGVPLPVALLLPIPSMTALAGAFIWVANDFTSRARRWDFSPSDVHWGSLRIAAAIPLGYAFAFIIGAPGQGGESTDGAFISFAIAAFPLNETQRTIRRFFAGQSVVAKVFQIPDETDETLKLQGVNNNISARLAQEDITTITQVAYCDPIRISMRSGLPFNFITDCMNQALAWEYLEDGMDAIRRLGFRGAVELGRLEKSLKRNDPTEQQDAKDVLMAICEALNAKNPAAAKHTPETLRFVIAELARDPFTIYLADVCDTNGGEKERLGHRKNRDPRMTSIASAHHDGSGGQPRKAHRSARNM